MDFGDDFDEKRAPGQETVRPPDVNMADNGNNGTLNPSSSPVEKKYRPAEGPAGPAVGDGASRSDANVNDSLDLLADKQALMAVLQFLKKNNLKVCSVLTSDDE